MQFLKTLFWVALAVVLVLFGTANWTNVTLNLWGGLQADVKLPFLLLLAFLAGLVPTLVILRARIWTLKRRVEAHERQVAVTTHPYPPPATPAVPHPPEDRIATDSKVWPRA